MSDPTLPLLYISQGILIHPETKQLFIQQRPGNKKRPLLWEYPGGKVDELVDPKEDWTYGKIGDALEKGLIRELQEELGIVAKLDSFIGWFEYKVKDHAKIFLYTVKEWTGDIKATVARDTKWVDLNWAIDYMPMSPVIYDSYRIVQTYLNDYA